MINFNPITFLYDFFYYLVNFVSKLWDFLYSDVTLGSWTFKPLALIGASGGVTIIVLLIAKFIKEYVPLA